MRVLVVDDEEGIREGLASFLRHHHHVVHAAASCVEASTVLAEAALDVMVTDWRLTDGSAAPLLITAASMSLPVIVITGCPEEIEAGSATVLRKPVPPDALLAHLVAEARPKSATPVPNALLALPPDAQDRIRLLLCGLAPVEVAIDDDGTFVTATVDFGDGLLPQDTVLARLGGDWSVSATAEAGHRRGRWRFYRDGRPESVDVVIGPSDAWPPGSSPFAIDLHGHVLEPQALLALLDSIAYAHGRGRQVHVVNVPGHLRLWLELLGRAHELPMRTCSGPRLSAAARQLWS